MTFLERGGHVATPLTPAGLDTIFREARTHRAWLDRPLSDDLLHQLHHLAKWGPTSSNMCPVRLVFVKSKEAKERLRPTLSPGNVDKTMTAPVCTIVAQDSRFYELMPKLSPHNPKAGEHFAKPENAESTQIHAFRNSSLQGAYLIVAARALGLDAGPMSGFDNDKVDAEFFPDGRYKSNFLLNLGYGDASKLHPRAPRLEFDEACRII